MLQIHRCRTGEAMMMASVPSRVPRTAEVGIQHSGSFICPQIVEWRHQPCLRDMWSCETNTYTRNTRQGVLPSPP